MTNVFQLLTGYFIHMKIQKKKSQFNVNKFLYICVEPINYKIDSYKHYGNYDNIKNYFGKK